MSDAFSTAIPIGMVDYAQKIRETRKNLGLTQSEFAAAIGASQGSVSKWEQGREVPRLDAIKAIENLSKKSLIAVRSHREHTFSLEGGIREVEVIGVIQDGYGREDAYWGKEDNFKFQLPVSTIWGPVQLDGRLVRSSAWDDYPMGTIVVTASSTLAFDYEDDDTPPQDEQDVYPEHGDIVVCAVIRPDKLQEVVLRKCVILDDGDVTFWRLDNSREEGNRLPETYYGPRKGHLSAKFLGVVAAVIIPKTSYDRLVYIPDED